MDKHSKNTTGIKPKLARRLGGQFTAPLASKRSRSKFFAFVSVAIFTFSLVSPALFNGRASAATISQNDWSGGAGNNPANQYTAKTGVTTTEGISIDTSGGSITWCDTAKCNDSWSNRQKVTSNLGSGASGTNLSIEINVKHAAGMQADFDDLRFVSAGNDTDYKYYIVNKSDGEWANVLVELPTVTANINEFYMYYGYGAATSESDASVATFKSDLQKETTSTDTLATWGSEGSGSGQLQQPKGIEVNSSGDIYVADSSNQRIVKYNSSGTQIDSWGGDGYGNGQFKDPSDIAIDPSSDNLYVIDQGRCDVQIFSSTGDYITKFGACGSGNGQMLNPTGIALYTDSVYTVDNGNSRILWWDTAGNYIGANGSAGSGYGQFNDPRSIAIVPGGALAISDYGNHRIVRAAGDLTMTEGEINPAFIGSYGTGDGQLNNPVGLDYDSASNLYVADGANQRIVKFSPYGKFLGQWQTSASAGLDVTSSGNVFTTDFTNSQVKKFAKPDVLEKWGIHYEYEVRNGSVAVLGGNNYFSPIYWANRSVDRVLEMDVKPDYSATDCNSWAPGFELLGSYSSKLAFQKPPGCDDGNKYYKATTLIINDGDGQPVSDAPHIPADDFVRFRMVAHKDRGTDYYFSTDQGQTYTHIDTPSTDGDEAPAGQGINSTFDDSAVLVNGGLAYNSAGTGQTAFGIEEFKDGYTGTLESVVYDLGGNNTRLGDLSVTQHGSGSFNYNLYIRGSNDPENSSDYRFCGTVHDGDALDTSSCVNAQNARYIQYLVELSSSNGDAHIDTISFDYTMDNIPPSDAGAISIRNSPSDDPIPDGGWSRTQAPYISWLAATDEGGSGVQGYCLYVGADSEGDPATNKGAIQGGSPLNTQGFCPFAVDSTSVALQDHNVTGFDSGATVYVRIKAFDAFHNLSDQTATNSYRVDTSAPFAGTIYNMPSAINSKRLRFSWFVTGAFVDEHSGFAGFKYCVTSVISGLSGCDQSSSNWYGQNHTSGNIHDSSDVFPASAGELITVPADYDRLDDEIVGQNAIVVVALDYAGNVSEVAMSYFIITHTASDAPNNLQVTPTSNSTNAFAFTWQTPSLLFGSPGQTNYCWTVNVTIAADGSNCNYTGLGITQLAEGPYATRQGSNTLYIATKDTTGNFDNTKVASIDFSASTIAPGVPQNLELADVSIRANSSWKLAASWAAPSDVGSGIATYRILRSTDDITYTEVGSTTTSNTSFIDSNLSQVSYFYKIKACDNAGNCGPLSDSSTRRPTGRFTEPAKLTADTDQPRERDVTTRKATIIWYTDRESDSKVAIGNSPGNYYSQEIGNSTQTASHSVNLTNLEPGKRYYYITRWTDEDGNIGQSQEHSFSTLPAPSFSDVNPTNITVSSASITFTIENGTNAKLYYGKNESFGAVKSIDTSNEKSTYTIALNELEDGTKYFFKLNGVDLEGNEYQGNIYSFKTPARPKISNLAVNTIEGESSSTKRITWTTNVPTTSSIGYNPVGGKTLDVTNSELTTSHSIIISGLEDDTDYTLKASSRDAAGNSATSEGVTFHTALDTRPPKISNINIEPSVKGSGPEARGQTVISWTTDEPATSQVAYGRGDRTSDLASRTAKDERLTLEHTVVVSDLPTSSIYQIKAVSEDKSSNSALSDTQTAIIGRASQNVFSLIFTSLQRIFGLGSWLKDYYL